MQNKFTQKAQNTLKNAMNEAGALGHAYIGSEHILLGLAAEKDSIAARILFARGLGMPVIKNSIIEIAGEGERCKTSARDMTPRARNIIERSGDIAKKKGCTYIGTEHILASLLEEEGSTGVKIIEASGIPVSALKCDLGAHQSSFGLAQRPSDTGVENDTETAKKRRSSGMLALYSRDMTEAARTGKNDPTIGREEETDRVIRILCRRQKNNPCLIGEPGVGKTAVVEGLAGRIADGKVPPCLTGKRILSLDIASMIAGAKYRGEFEERMKSVMSEAEKSPDIILFVDELHVIVGAGAAEGAVDAANILKPALARGGIRLIGATTLDEYKRHIERDAALERRLQSILIDEPSVDTAIEILRGLRPRYEAHHKLKISDGAIDAAVKLSARYINDRYLPDKAIDLLDETAARMSIAASALFPDAAPLERELDEIKAKKEEAIFSQDFSAASSLREKETELKNRLDALKKEMKNRKNRNLFTVGEEQIADTVTSLTGIPVGQLSDKDTASLTGLEEKLALRVIGQDKAISAVCSAIRRGRLGLGSPDRPTGSFIFIGKTGVGKTELARGVAEELFGGKESLIRFDMSEFMEKHSVSRLIGSPPGYVGYGEGGQLTERVRRRQYCVVLFDEIEKAHPDVLNLLLQILEDGRLTDSRGRVVNFRNTVIIMTSNAGASECSRITGFLGDGDRRRSESANMLSALKQSLRPELLGRVDEIIVFDDLCFASLEKIAASMLNELVERARALGLDITFDASVAPEIAREAESERRGARGLRRIIAKKVQDKISLSVLDGTILPSVPFVFTREDMVYKEKQPV